MTKKKVSEHDRRRLRSLFVLMGKYEHYEPVKNNLQRQIDEIKDKYK